MGGHNAGEVAARLAVDVVSDCVVQAHFDRLLGRTTQHPFGIDPSLSDAGILLRTAIHLANMQVLELAGTSDELAGMGTTIVVALVAGDRLAVGHVGDSRLYLLSRERRLRQLTDDDSWVMSILAQDPGVDPAALRRHPMRNALTNVVGARACTDVHVAEETLTGGEVLLLSTDGVHGVLDDRGIEGMLAAGLEPRPVAAHPSRIAEGVVRAALASGSRDNCTAVVARYAPDCPPTDSFRLTPPDWRL
jgi:protein phosphatase